MCPCSPPAPICESITSPNAGEAVGAGLAGGGGIGWAAGGAAGLGIGLHAARGAGAVGGMLIAEATWGGAVAGGVIGGAVGAVGAIAYLAYSHFNPPSPPAPKMCPCRIY